MKMGLKKVWLWGKLILILLVVAYITLFFSKNGEHGSKVFLFFNWEPWSPLNVIVLVTAVATLVVFYTVRKVGNVLHAMNQLRQAEQAQERERRMEDLAREMEKRLQSTGAPPKEPDK